MIGMAYLGLLVASLACIVLADRRWRVFFWAHPRRAAVVQAAGFVFFLVWDLAAIRLGLYERGRSRFMTGIEVARDLPVEELFFIAFLPYLTMVLHGLLGRRPAARAAAPERVAGR